MTHKRLTKSRDDRMIAGVCGGLAEYFGIDTVLVRIAFVLLGLFGGGGVIAYIVMMLIMPEPSMSDTAPTEPRTEATSEPPSEPPAG